MYILDTNIVSEMRKIKLGKANANVAKWADTLDVSALYLSVITLQELEIGILLLERRDSAQGATFRAWMTEQVLPVFSQRIIAVDLKIAQQSALLHVPNPRPVRDCLIAATALVHGMTVVTRNVSDFEVAGLNVINPFERYPN